MAKKKKNANAGRLAGVGGLAGGLVSNLAQELLSDGAEKLLNLWTSAGAGSKAGKKEQSAPADAGLVLLLALEGRQSRRVSDLLAGVGRRAGVSAAMEALRSAGELDLVRPLGKAGARVRLTRLGRETAEAVRACLAEGRGKKGKQRAGDDAKTDKADPPAALRPDVSGQNGA